MNPKTLQAIVLVVVAALIFAAGWAVEGWRMEAQITDLKKTQADAKRLAAEENATKLTKANQRADSIALQLAGWENTLTIFAQEKERELSRLTVGRPCLNGAVVRVLNQPAIIKQPGALPETVSESLRPDAAFATDTDVGTWIASAQRAYDTCRGRLDAIAHFYEDLPSE